MGFFSNLFGGSSAGSDASVGSSVNYPERFTMAPEASPLLKNGEAFLSAAISRIGIPANAKECLEFAASAVHASSGLTALWEELASESARLAGGWDSRAVRLSTALWTLCAPFGIRPSIAKNDGIALEVKRRLAALAKSAGLDVPYMSDNDTSLYFSGAFGWVQYGLTVSGYSPPAGAPFVEIRGSAYIGRFPGDGNHDGWGYLDATSEVMDRFCAPMFVLPGNLGARTTFSIPIEDARDPGKRSLEVWMEDFLTTLVAADTAARKYIDLGLKAFTPQERDGTRPQASAVANWVNARLVSAKGLVQTEDLALALRSADIPGFKIKGSECFAEWGDDILPVLVSDGKCFLRIPLGRPYENVSLLAFSLNSEAECSVWSNGPARSLKIRGGWMTMDSDREAGASDLGYMVAGTSADGSFLVRAAIEMNRQLGRLSARIRTDRSLSYLRLLKKSVGVEPINVRSSFFPNPGDDIHINPRRRGAEPETEAEKRERLLKEAKEERRKRAAAQGRAALMAGDGKAALRFFQEAENNGPSYDNYHIEKALAHLCSGEWDSALTAAAPLYDTNRVPVIVVCGCAHLLNGDESEASRHFRRAADLI